MRSGRKRDDSPLLAALRVSATAIVEVDLACCEVVQSTAPTNTFGVVASHQRVFHYHLEAIQAHHATEIRALATGLPRLAV